MEYDFSADVYELEDDIASLQELLDRIKRNYERITTEEAKSIIDSGGTICSIYKSEGKDYHLFYFNKLTESEHSYLLQRKYSNWYGDGHFLMMKGEFNAIEWYKETD